MADILKINSKNILVTLAKEDIAEAGLQRWIKSNEGGLGRTTFIDEAPIERHAAKLIVEKFPSNHVKYCKTMKNSDGTLSIFAAVTDNMSKDFIEENYGNTLTFKQEQTRNLGNKISAEDSIIQELHEHIPEYIKRAFEEEELNKIYFTVATIDELINDESVDIEGFSSEEDIFNYLLNNADIDATSGSFFENIPWDENDKIVKFNLENTELILAYTDNKATLYAEIDVPETSDVSIESDEE